jgi:antitoxin (DNA-binding transcriptional repressor) of toxin-antitoxin stability system
MAQKVYTIYEAKTQLSKLGKRAAAGQTIHVGAYGQATFVIAPLPPKQKKGLRLGVFAHKADPNFDYESLVGTDPELNALLEESINQPFPGDEESVGL